MIFLVFSWPVVKKRTLQAMDWPEMLLQAMFESFPCANDKLYAK
jgi:hypothetical protein